MIFLLVVQNSILLWNMTPVTLLGNSVFVVTYFDSFNIIFHLASEVFHFHFPPMSHFCFQVYVVFTLHLS